MREGIGRDGRHLFPAFPYTSFAKVTDFDLQSIYAYLMAQPAISAPNRPAEMRAPFGWRPLMAVWNTLFHRAEAFQAQPGQDEMWNRGAYFVEGLGHCSACHSPRNSLGAELKGADRLAGGEVDGWFAPPLNGTSPAPIPWTEQAFFDYLRNGLFGRARRGRRPHGAGGGRAQERCRIRTSARWPVISHRSGDRGRRPRQTSRRASSKARRRALRTRDYLAGSRIYDGACAVCHEPGQGLDMFGVKPSLVLVTADPCGDAGYRAARHP